MAPRLKGYGFAATLFIYQSAISNAKCTMTCPELIETRSERTRTLPDHAHRCIQGCPAATDERRTLRQLPPGPARRVLETISALPPSDPTILFQ
jgi:hypothetical protein